MFKRMIEGMTTPDGWSPLREPRRSSDAAGDSDDTKAPARRRSSSSLGNGLITTPFTQLARVHALSAMGDGAIAVALAGSIFFSIDPSDARWRVALYLVLTIAPFAVVTPLLGPAIDRAAGGRRGMIIGSLALRMLIAFFMIRHIDSLLLFPEAFIMLVLQKGYGVSKIALVPAVCPREDELVEANSKLTLIAAITGVIGGAIGVGLIAIFGNSASLVLAAIIFATGVFAAIQLPQVKVATAPVDETEKIETRGANIILAATAIAVLRGIVGFTTFLLAFHLRAGDDGADITEPGALLGATAGAFSSDPEFDYSQVVDLIGTEGPPQWHFAVAGLAAGSGAFLGARYAPIVRDRTTEERIVLGAMIATAVTAFLGAWGGGITGTAMLAFGVGISAAMGKLGFDALVQRDAPRSNHGRTFAKFEGRFQMMWAIGALLAVIIRFPIQLGALIVAIAAGLSAVSYELGRRTDRAQASSRVGEVIRERVPASRPFLDRLSEVSSNPKMLLPSRRAEAETSAPPPPSPSSRPTTPADPTLVDTSGTDPTVVDHSDPSMQRPTPAQLDETTTVATINNGDADRGPKAPVVQTGKADDIDKSTGVPIDRVEWSAQTGPQVSSGDGVWVAPDDPQTGGPDDGGQYRLWD